MRKNKIWERVAKLLFPLLIGLFLVLIFIWGLTKFGETHNSPITQFGQQFFSNDTINNIRNCTPINVSIILSNDQFQGKQTVQLLRIDCPQVQELSLLAYYYSQRYPQEVLSILNQTRSQQ